MGLFGFIAALRYDRGPSAALAVQANGFGLPRLDILGRGKRPAR